MFRHIAAFELRYQLTSPTFWVTSLIFFLLAFAATTSDTLQIGWGGQVFRNAPYAIVLGSLVLVIWAVFIVTAFVSDVVLRDEETGFGPIMHSTRISDFDYLFGRFAGACGAACLAFLSVPLGSMIGAAMPWLDPETVGPFRLTHYAYVYFVLCVPTLCIMGAAFFALATATRSMFASYIGALLLVALYYAAVLFLARPGYAAVATWLDPFGLSAFGGATRTWTPSERNVELPPMTGPLLGNRLLWLAVALLMLAFTWRAFRRARQSVPSVTRPNRELQKAAPANAPSRQALTQPPSHRELSWGPLVALARFDVLAALRSPAYAVMLGIAFLNALVGLWIAGDDAVSVIYPVTRVMIQTLIEQFTVIPLVIVAYYAGELVWRDRERRVNEIVDATPAPDLAFLAPKILACALVLFTMALVSVAAAITVQALKGYTTFELSHYISWYVMPWLVDTLLYAVLAVFVQTLVPHKFVGLLVMLLFIVGQLALPRLGLEHHLYRYGSAPPVPLSDMNGQGNFAGHAAWFRAYWTAGAVILAVLAYALWRRGIVAPLGVRLRRLPHRLAGPAGWILGGAGVAMTALGGVIYYNTNVLNEYRTFGESERWSARFEQATREFASVPQPRITNVTLAVDIYPSEPRVVTRGTYIIENKTGAPLREVHVFWPHVHESRSFIGTLATARLELTSLDVAGARLTRELPDFNYRIYTFDTPLGPGERREIRFETLRQQRGFLNSNNEARVVANGTFLDNFQLTPMLGVTRQYALNGRTKRRQYDLPDDPGPAKLEDVGARLHHSLRRDSDWVNADLTVSTVEDQTVLAPGQLVDMKVANGRRIARFRTEAPMHNFFVIQSAAYAVREDRWKDIPLAVYYHPAHVANVDSMVVVMKESLEYYTTNFSPFQFKQLRVVEFPAYNNFAQSFPGAIAHSEAAGFIYNPSKPQNAHLVTYITAHETAHQWWFHQVVGADMEGQTVLSETLAQYSALMIMERRYGAEQIRTFLKRALDGYLRGRGTEAAGERPLGRANAYNQAYISYQKGTLAMYLLKERIGEEAVNRALRALLQDFAFKGPPYPCSQELVDRLRAVAGPEHQQLISDLFEKITLYDLKVARASSTRRPDGKWDVVMEVEARKLYADEKGVETEATLDEAFDVGVFAAEPGTVGFSRESVLSMQRQRVQSGRDTLTVVVDKAPSFVGLDPYNKYVDRNSRDNVRRVEVVRKDE
ncbi:MAG: M1 family aminopeptidase [Gemmatimonadaceae bacterium]|nr:M1 family aminopeptidase [Gemmatimonadaceae bacterium]